MLRSTVLALSLGLLAAPAAAGPFDGWFRPPGSVGGSGGVVQVQNEGTVADLVARIQRLEGQNRLLTGQVQELQNAMRRTAEDFRKYRDDTDYRLQTLENGGKAPPMPKRSEAPARPGRGVDRRFPGKSGPGTAPGTLGHPGQGTLETGGNEMVDGERPDAGPDPRRREPRQGRDPNAPMQLPRYEPPPGDGAGARLGSGTARPARRRRG